MRSHSQHRRLNFCSSFFLNLSSLSLTLTLCVLKITAWEETSPQQNSSLSISTVVILIYIILFHSFSISFPLPLWFSPRATLSFTLLTLFTSLSLHSASLSLSVCYHSLSLPPLLLYLPFRSLSGSWSASWWTPEAAPWEEVVTTACASSSHPESVQRPPESPVGWSRDTNWHLLLRWWKEKAWQADSLRSDQQVLSSLGKT